MLKPSSWPENEPQGVERTSVAVRVWFFGLVATMTGERDVGLELPSGATVRDVLAALGRRYGETFLGNLMRTKNEKASCCRVSLNGRVVKDLDAPVAAEGAATVEIILLSAPEGG